MEEEIPFGNYHSFYITNSMLSFRGVSDARCLGIHCTISDCFLNTVGLTSV